MLVLLPGPILGALYTMPLFLESSLDTQTQSCLLASVIVTPYNIVSGQVRCAGTESEVRSYTKYWKVVLHPFPTGDQIKISIAVVFFPWRYAQYVDREYEKEERTP